MKTIFQKENITEAALLLHLIQRKNKGFSGNLCFHIF